MPHVRFQSPLPLTVNLTDFLPPSPSENTEWHGTDSENESSSDSDDDDSDSESDSDDSEGEANGESAQMEGIELEELKLVVITEEEQILLDVAKAQAEVSLVPLLSSTQQSPLTRAFISSGGRSSKTSHDFLGSVNGHRQDAGGYPVDSSARRNSCSVLHAIKCVPF